MEANRSTQFEQENVWNFSLVLFLVVFLITAGTAGYHFIEGWNLLDSFYMTVITLSTVGYREVEPLSPWGKGFTALLIMAGVGVVAYALTLITRAIVEGEVKRSRTIRKMRNKIANHQGHTIVCGCGRLGEIVVRDLVTAGVNVVVVENDPAVIQNLTELGVDHVEGQAYEDETLLAAGVKRAENLLALLSTDADNVYTILCARELNSELKIITRTEGETGENRLIRAGADQVLSPYRVSGSRIVQQLIRPNVSDFLEIAASSDGAQLVLEEVRVPQESSVAGQTLEASQLRSKTGAIIAAFIDKSGKLIISPGRESLIEPGSTMIVLGEPESLAKVYRLVSNG